MTWPTSRIKKIALVYIGYFLSGFLHEHFKFLYDWKRQVLCIFECAKILKIHPVCQKYEYEYDKNVELSIYYSTPQSLCLIL